MVEVTLQEVLKMCNIDFPTGTKVRIRCPFCQTSKINKDFQIDFSTESFGCFKCGITSRYGISFYALYRGISNKEAYKEIVNQLGMPENNQKPHFRPRENPKPQVSEDATIAPIEILDQTYRKLMEKLSLSEKNKEDLLSRGFTEDEILSVGYVTYPKKDPDTITKEYFTIPKDLLDESCVLQGVPGFFRTKNKGVWSLCLRKGGILVPYRDFNNHIQGFQLRKNDEELEVDEETGEREYKYSWIASGGLIDGCKASAKIHYAVDFKWNPDQHSFSPDIKGNRIMLTEGAMKGDLAHAISGIPIICVPGVSSAQEALLENIPLLKSIGIDTIVIAYDMDRVMNLSVAKALRAIKELIESNGMTCLQTSWSNKVMHIDKSIEIMDVANTFVITTEMLQKWGLNSKKMLKALDDAKTLNLKVYFALRDTNDVTKENHEAFLYLKKECEKRELQISCVFWSLHLKGIDDYYAHTKRDIQYK